MQVPTATRNAGRPDDRQLSTLDFRIQDPAAVPGYSRDRPDIRLEPTIIGHYDLRPTGGRKRLQEEPYFWCCHCQKDNHWSGFVVTNQGGRSYSVGKDCASSHYGVEFSRTRRNFADLTNRQGVLERLERIHAGASLLNAEMSRILQGQALAAIDMKRKEIEKANPNAAYLLSAAANSGADLYEDVQVRDAAAERKRADRLGDRDPKTPIWRSERSRLGPLEGAALVRTQFDCRDRLISLRSTIQKANAAWRDDTNRLTTGELTRLVKKVEEAHAQAKAGLTEYSQATAFFSPRNLDRISRWAAGRRDFSIVVMGRGFAFRSPDEEDVRIMPVEIDPIPEVSDFGPDAASVPVEPTSSVIPHCAAGNVR